MRDSVDELDLELLNALQITPRAPWSQLGPALGVDPATVARRWELLRASGTAWMTCALGTALHGDFLLAFVWVRCRPGAEQAAVARLAASREVQHIHRLTGPAPLLVVVGTRTVSGLDAALSGLFESAPDIAEFRAEVCTAGYGEPTRWRLRALGPAQSQALAAAAQPPSPIPAVRPHALDPLLYELLREDGRMSVTALAARAAVGEATVRRRINILMNADLLRVRCEVAQPATGWPVTVVLRCSVPPEALDHTGRAVAALPDVRTCCALTGASNLLLLLWLRSPQDLPRAEAALTSRFPDLRVDSREVCLRTVKQLGRLLDENGRAVGYVAGPALETAETAGTAEASTSSETSESAATAAED